MTQETEFFTTVARVAATLLAVPYCAVIRYEPDSSATIVAESTDRVGHLNLKLDGPSVMRTILQTGRSASITSYAQLQGDVAANVRGAGFDEVFGTPITVNESTWGAFVSVVFSGGHLPPGLEGRLDPFAEVVATALESAQVRDEQAALRRIATLVAAGEAPSAIFAAVCEATGQLVGADAVSLCRFTDDGFFVAAGGWSRRVALSPRGTRFPITGDSISATVRRTGLPARKDTYEDATGDLAGYVRDLGLRSSVAAPILVEGRAWGAIIAASHATSPLPAGTEDRALRFAELVAIAILNATARAELVASRARIVAAGDEARRRFERNLHDGVQQRLIALGLDLKPVLSALPTGEIEARSAIERLGIELESVLTDVQELSRGLHPVLLSRRGVSPSLWALARRSPVPVELHIALPDRPPEPIEIAIYYLVSELLTNVAKHAHASYVLVDITTLGEHIEVKVSDDGAGGADTTAGTGLIGLIDRVEALGGRLAIASPAGEGTTVTATLPTTNASLAEWH